MLQLLDQFFILQNELRRLGLLQLWWIGLFFCAAGGVVIIGPICRRLSEPVHAALRGWRARFDSFGMLAQICALSVGVVALDARELGHPLCCFVAIANCWGTLRLCLLLSWIGIFLLILLLRSVFFVFGLLYLALTRVPVLVLFFHYRL